MQALKACIILYSGRIHPQVLEQQIVSLGKKINVRVMIFSIFITLCYHNAFPSTSLRCCMVCLCTLALKLFSHIAKKQVIYKHFKYPLMEEEM